MKKRFFGKALVLVSLLFGGVVLDATAQNRPPLARSQTRDAGPRPGIVRGIITEAASGEALQGVNIVLRDSLDAFTGTVSDGDGIFVLSRVQPGRYTLQISFIGYETVRDTFELASGEVYDRSVAMEESSALMDEVVVEAEVEGGPARISGGLQTVRPGDMELVPTPDVTADLAGFLTTLPGVVATGDRGGQLFIRGGEPSHTLSLLDGMFIYQPFHVLGFYSAFPADILNRADLYAGGYGAKYSGRVSSVIDVYTKNGNKREHNRVFSVSPFMNTFNLEGPLIKDRISVLGSVRQSVIDRIASKYVGQELPYRFGDVFGKVHINVTKNSQFSVSTLYTYDQGALDNVRATARNEVRWNNFALGGRYLALPRRAPVRAELLFSVSRMDMEIGPRSEPTRSSHIESFNAAINLVSYNGKTEFNWGGSLRASRLNAQLGGLFQNFETAESRQPKVSFYFEPDVHLGGGWQLRVGGLAQFFDKFGSFIEPRARLVWTGEKHQVSAAGGLYHQEISGLNDRRDATNIFTAWVDAPFEELTKSTHILAGYQFTPSDNMVFSIEGFYKDLKSLYISEWTPFPRLTTNLQQADGDVKGLDIRFEYTLPNAFAYVTYGLSEVEYRAQQASLAQWYGTDELPFRPPHDRRHQINVLLGGKLADFDIQVRWNYGSGLPYNQIIGFDRFLLLDGEVDLLEDPGNPRVIYDLPYGGTLPAYHRLDISADRTFPFKGGGLTIQAGVINVYNRTNLFSLDLFTLQRTDQLPIIPNLGLKLDF